MTDSDSKPRGRPGETAASSDLILPEEHTGDEAASDGLGEDLYFSLGEDDRGVAEAQDLLQQAGVLLPLAADQEDKEDSASDGLELDDLQSEEIRQIFGTTLPQYLLPIEEMLEQILSGSGDPETVQALLGTLSSIEAAAARMGFGEVCQQLRQIGQLVAGLELTAAIPRELREQILGELLDLKDLALQMGGQAAAPAAAAPTKTIYAALKGNKEIGELALRKLSAAGVVTVEQLLMARADEVAVVSGLDLALVNKLLQIVAPQAARMPEADPVAAVDAAPEAALAGKLTRRLEAQAALDESKARLLHLRGLIQERRAALDRLAQQTQAQRLQEAALRQRLAQTLGLLGHLRESRDALTREVVLHDQALRQSSEQLFSLKQKWQELVNQDNQLDVEIEALVERVGGVLRLISDKKVSTAGRSRRND